MPGCLFNSTGSECDLVSVFSFLVFIHSGKDIENNGLKGGKKS